MHEKTTLLSQPTTTHLKKLTDFFLDNFFSLHVFYVLSEVLIIEGRHFRRWHRGPTLKRKCNVHYVKNPPKGRL